uniref:SXP/RAL-2 family protein Ani s 5-like cation-binding domain-containing protein n=1 Tax=Ascaris lumbricoides TaxID=6252 RepID=A0A0M3IHX8_ASCLU
MKASIIFCAVFVVLCVRARRPSLSSESHEFGLRQRFGVPPFANGTSDEAKHQLMEIFKNKSLTKEQINEKVQEWVNSQDSSVQVTLFVF